MPDTLFVPVAFDWSVALTQLPTSSSMHSRRTTNVTLLTPFHSRDDSHDALMTALRTYEYQHVYLCSNFAPHNYKLFRLSLQNMFRLPIHINGSGNDQTPRSYEVAIHARTGIDVLERHTDPRFRYLDNVSDKQLVTALFDCAIAHCQSHKPRIFFASDSLALTGLAMEHGRKRNFTVFTVGDTSKSGQRTENETRDIAANEWWMLTKASVAVVTTKSAFSKSAFAMSNASRLVRVRAWKKQKKRTRCQVVIDYNKLG